MVMRFFELACYFVFGESFVFEESFFLEVKCYEDIFVWVIEVSLEFVGMVDQLLEIVFYGAVVSVSFYGGDFWLLVLIVVFEVIKDNGEFGLFLCKNGTQVGMDGYEIGLLFIVSFSYEDDQSRFVE